MNFNTWHRVAFGTSDPGRGFRFSKSDSKTFEAVFVPLRLFSTWICYSLRYRTDRNNVLTRLKNNFFKFVSKIFGFGLTGDVIILCGEDIEKIYFFIFIIEFSGAGYAGALRCIST